MATREAKHVELQQNLQPVMVSFHPSKLCTVVIHNKPGGTQNIFDFCHGYYGYCLSISRN